MHSSRVLQALDQYQNSLPSSSNGNNAQIPLTTCAPNLASGSEATSTGRKRTADADGEHALTTPSKRPMLEKPPYSQSQRWPNESLHNQAQLVRSHAAGFSINYDWESRVERIDRNGKNTEEQIEEFVKDSMYRSDITMSVKESMRSLGLKSLKDVLPGMDIRLMRHQIIGVNWMVNQERKTKYKGGILADEMGLGKTVQMITTMALNAPNSEADGPRATLIVVPLALLLQWKEEIETKTNDLFRVHVQHGRTKLKTLGELQDYDVVITTYHTLNYDFTVPDDLDSADEMNYLNRYGGLLARIHWYRVVLDEAQVIRNRKTRASKAVAKLRAKYRWMLTGTPVTNSLADLYGLIRFGRFRPWNNWEDFDEWIAKVQMTDPPLAGLRAQEILKSVLIRRTKTDELEGTPLLVLPPKDVEIVHLEFSEDERLIYDNFERKVRIEVNKFIRRNCLLKNSAVLVMILRLRQLCCHPNLILSIAEDYEDPSLIVGNSEGRELAKAIKVMGKNWVDEIKKRFAKRANMESLDFGSTKDDDGPEMSCPVCHDFFMNGSGRVLQCGHEICNDCLTDLLQSPMPHSNEFQQGSDAELANAEKEYEMAVKTGARPCPTCHKNFDARKVFLSAAFKTDEPPAASHGTNKRSLNVQDKAHSSTSMIELESSSDEDMPDINQILRKRSPKSKSKKKKEKSLDNDGESQEDDDVTDITLGDIVDAEITKPSVKMIETWKRSNFDLEPSAKMVALMNLIKQWDIESNYDDKVICYSQWTSMLDLVETMFQRQAVKYLRYDGKMSREAREATLAVFKKSGGPRVILISTKSGSVGLNLVSANRIVNLDLAWNWATESQAYDRVHRVGQNKDVFIKRLVVKNTIEERMLKLQDVKTGLADAALGEGSAGNKLHKMSVKELRALFGMAPKDNGNA